MTTTWAGELPAELRRFRRAHRLADECAAAVAARLREGVTERGAAPGCSGRGCDSKDPEARSFWLDDDLPHLRRWAEDE